MSGAEVACLDEGAPALDDECNTREHALVEMDFHCQPDMLRRGRAAFMPTPSGYDWSNPRSTCNQALYTRTSSACRMAPAIERAARRFRPKTTAR